MASKKEKLLESAQRYLLKGQLDKAIKDYQQVVAMEPNDVRYRQRLAELLVRDHRKQEAITQYEDIGKHYADNSYFLKAIAIYKQIQRLSPNDNSVALTIASLNHQQGLTGNALAEYGQIVALYEKEGALKEALKVVEKMLGVDGEHVPTRVKHAELLHATGALDASREAFATLLNSLSARGRDADAQAVAGRMREYFPDQGSAPAPVHQEHLAADVFAAADHHDASDDLPAPWETEEPVQLLSGSTPQPQPEPELPDAFAPASAEPADFPFELEPSQAAPSVPGGEPEPQSAWEEEIELDLDDDFPLEFASAPDPATASPVVPEPPSLEPASFEPASEPQDDDRSDQAPVDASPFEAPVAPPAGEIDLQLDFSLNLDFDEAVQSLEEDPIAEETPEGEHHGVVELDLGGPEEDGGFPSLELSEEGSFADLPWPDAEEAVEPAVPEELEEPEEFLEPEELLEPELLEEHLEPLGSWDEPESAAAAEEVAVPVRGWDEIYPEADQGEEMDLQELESHYDLGIGYKEMGMYAGAIKEFDIAARNPQRRADCLSLQAMCYREKGEGTKAEELLRRGLSLTVLAADERIALGYELAVLLEETGAVDEAIGLYREVRRENPAYHDVSRRLSALSGEEHLDIIDLELEEG